MNATEGFQIGARAIARRKDPTIKPRTVLGPIVEVGASYICIKTNPDFQPISATFHLPLSEWNITTPSFLQENPLRLEKLA